MTTRGFAPAWTRADRMIYLVLAHHLLRGDPAWTEARMMQVIVGGQAVVGQAVAGGQERTVPLAIPVAVHISLLYWTAVPDHEGRINFRMAVYDRDLRVWSAAQVGSTQALTREEIELLRRAIQSGSPGFARPDPPRPST